MLSFVGSFFPSIQNINNTKPIIPYNEPSHYALFLCLFFTIKRLLQIRKKNYIYNNRWIYSVILKEFYTFSGGCIVYYFKFQKKSIIILVVTGLLMFLFGSNLF